MESPALKRLLGNSRPGSIQNANADTPIPSTGPDGRHVL
jgi:hypothetical protein